MSILMSLLMSILILPLIEKLPFPVSSFPALTVLPFPRLAFLPIFFLSLFSNSCRPASRFSVLVQIPFLLFRPPTAQFPVSSLHSLIVPPLSIPPRYFLSLFSKSYFPSHRLPEKSFSLCSKYHRSVSVALSTARLQKISCMAKAS